MQKGRKAKGKNKHQQAQFWAIRIQGGSMVLCHIGKTFDSALKASAECDLSGGKSHEIYEVSNRKNASLRWECMGCGQVFDQKRNHRCVGRNGPDWIHHHGLKERMRVLIQNEFIEKS